MSLNANTFVRPTGFRRLNLDMLAIRDRADQFAGVPRGTAKPLTLLAAFQEAEPYLGLPSHAFKLISWLVKQTMAIDWEEGSRPIVWPSARRQQEFLNLSAARVKVLNRALYEAGIFVIRDNPQGKRYGRRDHEGRIIEAYGFDLTPLAERHAEFVRLAAEARTERKRMKELRARITIARRAVAQAGEMLEPLGPIPEGWRQLVTDMAALTAAARRVARSEELSLVATSAERLKSQAEQWVRSSADTVNKSPVGLVSEPHTISTNKPYDLKDTVISAEESSPEAREAPKPSPPVFVPEDVLEASLEFKPFETVEKLHPGELLELAPRLAAHIPQNFPDWNDIVDAAGSQLRHELGVSQALWGDSCRAVGRQIAAVTLAIVSTKPQEHFTRGAGGYFAAMIKRAKTGELHLDRSLWKLRRDRWDRPSDGTKTRQQARTWG
jgi:replication initiation protein RepC